MRKYDQPPDKTSKMNVETNTFFLPIDLLNGIDNKIDSASEKVFFSSPKTEYQKMREAWAASVFCSALSRSHPGSKVGILEEFPDFEIKIGSDTLKYEFTEVMKPNRKRSEEYRDKTEILREYRPAKCSQEGPDWIIEAVEKKIRKNYRPIPHLLVYANFEGRPDIVAIRAKCPNEFLSTWILCGTDIIQLFPSKYFGEEYMDWAPSGIDSFHPRQTQ